MQRPDPELRFDRLHGACPGLLETLVLADTWGLSSTRSRRRLLGGLCGQGPVSRAGHRRRRLVSLGLLTGARDAAVRGASLVTPLGRQVLITHAAEVAETRKRIEDLLEAELEADLAFADAMEDACLDDAPGAATTPGDTPEPLAGLPDAPRPEALPAPPRLDERVAVTAATLAPYVAHLDLPGTLLAQIAAALSAGKHLLLAGPPGTGKTDLALALGAAAAAEGYCRGMRTVTASADWTTFETIGGYALEPDGGLRFRAGVFAAALEHEEWLLVDELNRADVDRAFGELYTVLAGRGASTPFRRGAEERAVSIGPEEEATYRVRASFRLIATLNTWDRAGLFRLSAALLRRFAVVHVGPPDDRGYARLIDREAGAALDPGVRAALGRLFSSAGLLPHCPVGPAIAIDVVRYLRQRGAGGDGLAEAVCLLLLPQLEGLPAAAAPAVASLLDAELGAAVPARALEEVRARLREIFPDFEGGRARPRRG